MEKRSDTSKCLLRRLLRERRIVGIGPLPTIRPYLVWENPKEKPHTKGTKGKGVGFGPTPLYHIASNSTPDYRALINGS